MIHPALHELELTLRGPDGTCIWSWLRIAPDDATDGARLALFLETALHVDTSLAAVDAEDERITAGGVLVGTWQVLRTTHEIFLPAPRIPDEAWTAWCVAQGWALVARRGSDAASAPC